MTSTSNSVSPQPPHNLPSALSRFLGRQEETREVLRAIAEHRMTTLTGAGGCGKTRLSLQVASLAIENFKDGAWFVELGATTRDGDVARDIARVFGLREEAGRESVETLKDALRGRELLLVLDNCEHLLDGCAKVATQLLLTAPGVRMLATSRESLGVEGEWTWRVPSLDTASASTLFVERSRLVRPKFEPDESDTVAIAALVEQLDGLPLAIELAAARSRMMQPSRILESLSDRFRLLTGGSRQKLARQQTLEASVAWSYDLLAADERHLAQRLSVMRDFDLDAAQAVGGRPEEGSVVELLTRLVDKSLLVAEHDNRNTRYRFLETVRQFLLTRLQRCGEIEEVRHRHLQHFLALAERLAPHLASREGPKHLAELQVNLYSIDSALEWSEATLDSEAMLRLVIALSLFFELGGHLAHGGRWFARALSVPAGKLDAVSQNADGEYSVRARALWGAAHVAFYGGQYALSHAQAEEALQLAQASGDRWAEGRALNTLGALQSLAEPAAAREALTRSVALGRALNDDWAVGDGLKMTTVAWYTQHGDAEVKQSLEELRRVGESLGSRFFLAWQQAMVGYFARDRGELEAAATAYASAAAHSQYVGDPSTGGFVECWSALLDMDVGRFESARVRLEYLLATASAKGSELAVPEALSAMGLWLLAHGDASSALELVEPHIAGLFEAGLMTWGVQLLLVQAASKCAQGNHGGAASALDRAMPAASKLGNEFLVALVDAERARLLLAEGDRARAEQLLHSALGVQARIGARPAAMRSLEILAGISALDESHSEATRVLSAADGLRQHMGLARTPAERAAHEALVRSLRAQLGETQFDSEWNGARDTSLPDLVEYVSRMRGQRKRPSIGWESLTPTELRVAALVAEGLTNPQIGERMFIARGTVKIHLAHVFTKLGIATRAQLAVRAVGRTN